MKIKFSVKKDKINDELPPFKISYASDELIEEVKKDIELLGEDEKIYIMYEKFDMEKEKEKYSNQFRIPDYVEFVTNYDFIVKENPLTEDEKKDYSKIRIGTLKELLEELEKQNDLFREDEKEDD